MGRELVWFESKSCLRLFLAVSAWGSYMAPLSFNSLFHVMDIIMPSSEGCCENEINGRLRHLSQCLIYRGALYSWSLLKVCVCVERETEMTR